MLGIGGIHSWKSIITILIGGSLLVIVQVYSGLNRTQFYSLTNPIMIIEFLITMMFVWSFEEEWKQEQIERKKLKHVKKARK